MPATCAGIGTAGREGTIQRVAGRRLETLTHCTTHGEGQRGERAREETRREVCVVTPLRKRARGRGDVYPLDSRRISKLQTRPNNAEPPLPPIRPLHLTPAAGSQDPKATERGPANKKGLRGEGAQRLASSRGGGASSGVSGPPGPDDWGSGCWSWCLSFELEVEGKHRRRARLPPARCR